MQEQLGIAGSGAIACGLAAVAAAHGEVVIAVRSAESAERARGAVDRHCGEDGEHAGRVRVETDLEALAEATYVVEAIVEQHDLKVELLRRLHAVAPDHAVLATTTSSLSIAALAAESGRPDRFAGLHVFNPVPRMELVELVFGPQASADTRARTVALCEALGKTGIEVPDVPGFVVNRLLFPYLFSAVRLLDETGMAPADVDACMKLGAGHPMGPLALLDLVGLDVSAAIGDELGVEVPQTVRTMVAEGRTGRKSPEGGFHAPKTRA